MCNYNNYHYLKLHNFTIFRKLSTEKLVMFNFYIFFISKYTVIYHKHILWYIVFHMKLLNSKCISCENEIRRNSLQNQISFCVIIFSTPSIDFYCFKLHDFEATQIKIIYCSNYLYLGLETLEHSNSNT